MISLTSDFLADEPPAAAAEHQHVAEAHVSRKSLEEYFKETGEAPMRALVDDSLLPNGLQCVPAQIAAAFCHAWEMREPLDECLEMLDQLSVMLDACDRVIRDAQLSTTGSSVH